MSNTPAIAPYITEILWHLEYRPYIDLPVKFDAKACFDEAHALLQEFVPHRNYGKEQSGGPLWKSLCIKGLNGDPTKTLYHTDYKVDTPEFSLTHVAERCPQIMAFLNDFTDVEKCQRIRLMLLEPGAKIHVHRDRPKDEVGIGINVALNNPEGCRFYMDTQESGEHHQWTHELPFKAGEAMLINVGKYHYVENNSPEARIHIIVDGPIRYSEETLINLARKQNKISSFRELASHVVCKRALQGYSLEESRAHFNFAKTLGVERQAIEAYMHIVLMEPAPSELAPRAELINMTTAGLFPMQLHQGTLANIDEVLRRLAGFGAKAVALVRAGTYVPIFWEFVYECLYNIGKMRRTNAYLAGHIMDYPGDKRAPFFHPQLTLVDLVAVPSSERGHLSQPPVDFEFAFPKYTRSAEMVHDNYTPLWLAGDEGEKGRRLCGWGSLAIAKSLSSGHKVLNLEAGLRKSKIYGYPEKNPSPELEKVRGEIQAVLKMTQDRVYMLNNEQLSVFEVPGFEPDVLFSVSAGFKPFAILNQYWAERNPEKIFFVDYSGNALEYLREISKSKSFSELSQTLRRLTLTEKLFQFMTDQALQDRLSEIIRDGFDGDESRLMKNLNRGSSAEFIQMDLVFHPEKLLSLLNDRPTFLFWHSNAWDNCPLGYLDSPKGLRQRYQDLAIALGRHYGETAWVHQSNFSAFIGDDPANVVGVLTEGTQQGTIKDFNHYRKVYSPIQEINL